MYSVNLLEWDGQGKIANCTSNLPIIGALRGVPARRSSVRPRSGLERGGRPPSFNIKTHVYIPAVMEHVELAGIHSGDSACVIPPVSIPTDNLTTIKDIQRRLQKA